jgi:hypothetical protein
MIGTIGTILGVAGNVASGVMSAINNKKARQQQEAEDARAIAYQEAKANEDPLSRASNQRLLSEYDRKAKAQVEQARNVAAITGATPEYTLAVQDIAAQGRADLMGDIAEAGEERADKAEELAEKARQRAAANKLELAKQRNQTYANLAANASNAAKSMISGIAPKNTGTYTGLSANGLSTDDSSTDDSSTDDKKESSNAVS